MTLANQWHTAYQETSDIHLDYHLLSLKMNPDVSLRMTEEGIAWVFPDFSYVVFYPDGYSIGNFEELH